MFQMKVFLRIFYFICFVALLCLYSFDYNEVEVPGWEFNITRNLNHYIHHNMITATIIPPDFCDKVSFLVIMVISGPNRFENRKVIRNTWGSDRAVMGYHVPLYFLVGQTSDLDVQAQLNQESAEFNDIIQENFYDTYNNLTLKSTMMLKLFTLKCQKTAEYLLKIDDDIYLNLPNLVNDLVQRNNSENLLMGSAICGASPIKNYRDKWYSGPRYLYPYHTYPDYISGTSYCMSGDVARTLLYSALETPIFHLEDVYLTGICRSKIGLNITHNGLFTYRHIDTDYCLFKSLITIHDQDPKSIKQIHKASQDPEVEKQCEQKSKVFFVHQWMVQNVLTLNVNKRRRRCS